jgi:hypothetical protein
MPVGTGDQESNEQTGRCECQEDQNHPWVFDKYLDN